jgi:hypothetical protein
MLPCLFHLIIGDLFTVRIFSEKEKLWSTLLWKFLQPPIASCSRSPNRSIFLSILFSNTLKTCSSQIIILRKSVCRRGSVTHWGHHVKGSFYMLYTNNTYKWHFRKILPGNKYKLLQTTWLLGEVYFATLPVAELHSAKCQDIDERKIKMDFEWSGSGLIEVIYRHLTGRGNETTKNPSQNS